MTGETFQDCEGLWCERSVVSVFHGVSVLWRVSIYGVSVWGRVLRCECDPSVRPSVRASGPSVRQWRFRRVRCF